MKSATRQRTIVQREKVAIRKGKEPEKDADRPPLRATRLMKAMAVRYGRFADMVLEPNTHLFE